MSNKRSPELSGRRFNLTDEELDRRVLNFFTDVHAVRIFGPDGRLLKSTPVQTKEKVETTEPERIKEEPASDFHLLNWIKDLLIKSATRFGSKKNN